MQKISWISFIGKSKAEITAFARNLWSKTPDKTIGIKINPCIIVGAEIVSKGWHCPTKRVEMKVRLLYGCPFGNIVGDCTSQHVSGNRKVLEISAHTKGGWQ
jgi:hypothetical protein